MPQDKKATKKTNSKTVPEGGCMHTIVFTMKATNIIYDRQRDSRRSGKKRSIEQIVNKMVEEQMV